LDEYKINTFITFGKKGSVKTIAKSVVSVYNSMSKQSEKIILVLNLKQAVSK